MSSSHFKHAVYDLAFYYLFYVIMPLMLYKKQKEREVRVFLGQKSGKGGHLNQNWTGVKPKPQFLGRGLEAPMIHVADILRKPFHPSFTVLESFSLTREICDPQYTNKGGCIW